MIAVSVGVFIQNWERGVDLLVMVLDMVGLSAAESSEAAPPARGEWHARCQSIVEMRSRISFSSTCFLAFTSGPFVFCQLSKITSPAKSSIDDAKALA